MALIVIVWNSEFYGRYSFGVLKKKNTHTMQRIVTLKD